MFKKVIIVTSLIASTAGIIAGGIVLCKSIVEKNKLNKEKHATNALALAAEALDKPADKLPEKEEQKTSK